jgi:hypothetical protein
VSLFATLPADPTGGAMLEAETSIQSWVLDYGVPVVVTLTVLGILIRLGMKWLLRAGATAGAGSGGFRSAYEQEAAENGFFWDERSGGYR